MANMFMSLWSRGIYCYDFNGKLIWEKDLGVQCECVWFRRGNRTIAVRDSVVRFLRSRSWFFIVALDKRTGKECGVFPGRTQLVEHTAGDRARRAQKQIVVRRPPEYAATIAKRQGNRESAGLGANVIPVPVYENGVVYVMTLSRSAVMAIKLARREI